MFHNSSCCNRHCHNNSKCYTKYIQPKIHGGSYQFGNISSQNSKFCSLDRAYWHFLSVWTIASSFHDCDLDFPLQLVLPLKDLTCLILVQAVEIFKKDTQLSVVQLLINNHRQQRGLHQIRVLFNTVFAIVKCPSNDRQLAFKRANLLLNLSITSEYVALLFL